MPSASRLYSLTTKNKEFSLKPEVSNTFELGYKKTLSKTELELAVYSMDIEDTITKYVANNIQYYANGGTTRHQGFELTWKQTINQQFATKLAYSYSQHHYVNDATYGNNEMAAAPKHLADLRLFYRPKNIKGLVTMAEALYQSDYWMDDSHTMKYAGYTVYYLKALYNLNRHWKMTAKVENLTDTRYAESASYSYGKENYTPAGPRQFYMGVNYQW